MSQNNSIFLRPTHLKSQTIISQNSLFQSPNPLARIPKESSFKRIHDLKPLETDHSSNSSLTQDLPLNITPGLKSPGLKISVESPTTPIPIRRTKRFESQKLLRVLNKTDNQTPKNSFKVISAGSPKFHNKLTDMDSFQQLKLDKSDCSSSSLFTLGKKSYKRDKEKKKEELQEPLIERLYNGIFYIYLYL